MLQQHTGLVTVVVTQIAWDGSIRRRARDTCSLTDAGRWQAQQRRAVRPTATSTRVRCTEPTADMGYVERRITLSDGAGHRERARSRLVLVDRALGLVKSSAVPDPDALCAREARQAGEMIALSDDASPGAGSQIYHKCRKRAFRRRKLMRSQHDPACRTNASASHIARSTN
jgi:hypothetical protein